MVSQALVRKLEEKALSLREHIVMDLIGAGKVGHLGGSCSSAEIVATLYFHKMRHDPKNPALAERDRFLLSKGHAALVQYAALALAGYFPTEELKNVKSLGGMLQGHPDMTRTPGVEANTGSLGTGAVHRQRHGSGSAPGRQQEPSLCHHRRRRAERRADLGGGHGRRQLQTGQSDRHCRPESTAGHRHHRRPLRYWPAGAQMGGFRLERH